MSNKPDKSFWSQTILPTLSLFTSGATLICCALPALLVTLGMGATLAGFIGVMPWITVVSTHKEGVFFGAGIMLTLSALLQWRGRYAPCPLDSRKAKACQKMRHLSWGILIVSISIYIIATFFAFFAADIFY